MLISCGDCYERNLITIYFHLLQTSHFYLHIFKVQFSDKRIHIGGKQPSALFLANINCVLNEQVPLSVKDMTV